MTRLAWNLVFVMALAVFMLGTFPGTARADDAGIAEVTSAWHEKPSGLAAWGAGSAALVGPLDGKLSLTYGWDSFKKLEEPSGRERYYDRSRLEAEVEFDLLLNSGEVAKGEIPLSLIAIGNFEVARDTETPHGESYPIRLLDYVRTGVMFGANAHSTKKKNGRFSFDATAVTGLAYIESGEFYGLMWRSRLEVEIGLQAWKISSAILGPTMGFRGDISVGEHSSAWLDAEAWVGFRAVHPDFRADLRFLGIGSDRDANTVTGSYLKVEHERVALGIELELTIRDVVSLGLRYERSLNSRFKVNSGDPDETPGLNDGFSFDTEQDSVKLEISFYF